MPCTVSTITNRMPTQREHSQHNPELKREEKSVRVQFLRHLDLRHMDLRHMGYYFSITRCIVYSLAVYGAYSLLS